MAGNNVVDIILKARDKASKDIDKVSGSLVALHKSGARTARNMGLVSSAMGGIVASSAPAVAGVGALASAFASAGVGVAGFATVAVANLNDVFEATDETFGNLSKEQQKAYKDLKTFKSFWGSFSKEFEKPSVEIFSKSLDSLQTILTKIRPAIDGTFNAVNGLMDSLNKSLGSPDMVRFFNYLGSTAEPMVTRFGQTFGNMFRGIANLLVAFAPLADSFTKGMVNMSSSFAEWSSGLSSSKGFQTFIEYAKTNTPLLIGTIKNLLSTLGNLIAIFAPLGTVVLGTLKEVTGALSTFTGKVKEAFSTKNFSEAGVALGELIPQIAQTLLSGLPEVFSTGTQIMQSIVKGLVSEIPNITNTVISLLTNIIDSMAVNYPMFINAGMELITSLIEGIVNSAPQIISSIFNVVNSLLTTVQQVVVTYLPVILQLGFKLLMSLIQGIVNNLPTLMMTAITMIETVLNTVLTQLPVLIRMGIQVLNAFIEGIVSMLPKLLPMVFNLIDTVVTTLIDSLPAIIDAGMELLVALINGVIGMLPELVKMAIGLIIQMNTTLMKNLPKIISAGVQLLLALIDGLIETIPELVKAIPEIVEAIFEAFGDVNWGEIGSSIIEGVWSGIKSMGSWIGDKVSGFAGNILGWAKDALDINSPSRVFANEVGRWIPAGIASGIEKNTKYALRALDGVNKEMVNKSSDMSVGLDFFRGGKQSMSLNLNLNVSGEVAVEGDAGGHTQTIASQSIGTQIDGSVDDILKGLRQAVRRR
ncbi:phage tail protein [Gracilibacillus lacisalsi]|uniref:phage tail protein n=1 Tax=Gracilibacillus lacisalsi TaxID=393087 RepID=UPI00035E11AF|nr:hypothetical protein [Gracilibacillus lacisalsi]